MLDTFKLGVLKTLTASLEQITIANGYQHDMGESVYRGRLLFTQEDSIPAVAINEPPQIPEGMEWPSTSNTGPTTHPLLVQGFVEDDQKNPTDPAYRLLGDVQKRLSYERTREEGFDILGLGKRITALHIGQAVVRPPDAVISGDSFFWLPITLVYAEDLQNPFAWP